MDVYLSICMENSVNIVIGGIGVLLSPHVLKSLNSIEKIQPRMMVAKLNGKPRVTIIFCFSPSNVSDETDLISFYNEQSSLVRCVLIISAQIGVDENNKFCLDKSSNRNREYLIESSFENRLTCLITKFQKREEKLWTYPYTTNVEAQTDYILMNMKRINQTLKCKAYSSFEGVSSNHRIVGTVIRHKQPKPHTMTDPQLTILIYIYIYIYIYICVCVCVCVDNI